MVIGRMRYNKKAIDDILYFTGDQKVFGFSFKAILTFSIAVLGLIGFGIYFYLNPTKTIDMSWTSLKYIVLLAFWFIAFLFDGGKNDYIEIDEEDNELDYSIDSYNETLKLDIIDKVTISEEKITFTQKDGKNHHILHQEFDEETKKAIYRFLKMKLKTVDLEVS